MICKTIDIWEGEIYHSEGKDGFRPTLQTYILDGSKKRGTVLICPGGGYGMTSEREAEPIALQFNAAGLNAFIVYYSVAPRKHPQPLLDVSRAMCIIRQNAEDWKVDSNKIAVCGFSAGGHLAASLGVHWDKEYSQNVSGIDKSMNKPNGMILCYPVISSGQYAHRGSFENLLGQDANEEQLFEMSLEHQITDKTPPAFIWHTFDDDAVPVENSLLFSQGLRNKNIPFELHIYPKGPHGLSLATAETDENNYYIYPHVATWVKLCTEWLNYLFEGGI